LIFDNEWRAVIFLDQHMEPTLAYFALVSRREN
jgi:hypothetical protein